jgi:hypothetical protein
VSVATRSFIRRARALLAFGFAASVISLVFGAAPASAGLGLACPDATTKPFSRWADYANYAYLPDGGFEAGAAGWKLASGAKVVSGNESFYIRSTSHRYALALPQGSSATSPPMCIGLLSSKMRFVVTGPSGSKVKVQVIYRGLLSSVLGILDGGTVSTNGTWQPSPAVSMLGGLLPLLTQSVQFRFVATSGTPRIDDVYLDPMKSG